MIQKDKEKAFAAAQEVLRSHWDGLLPIKTIEIARSCNLSIAPDFAMGNVAYRLERVKESVRLIYNATEPSVATRFFAAHALGVVLLGYFEGKNWLSKELQSFSLEDAEEWDWIAMLFATELIAPSKVLDHIQTMNNGYCKGNIHKIANVFDASRALISAKLNHLQPQH